MSVYLAPRHLPSDDKMSSMKDKFFKKCRSLVGKSEKRTYGVDIGKLFCMLVICHSSNPDFINDIFVTYTFVHYLLHVADKNITSTSNNKSDMYLFIV